MAQTHKVFFIESGAVARTSCLMCEKKPGTPPFPPEPQSALDYTFRLLLRQYLVNLNELMEMGCQWPALLV